MALQKKGWDFLVKIQEYIMVFTSLSLAIMVTISVLLRYVFKLDLYGIEEIEILVAMWLYFIGASYGSYTKSQISADVVEALVPESKTKQFIRCIRSILSVILYAGLVYLAYDLLTFNISSNFKTAIWKIPTYFTSAGILLGCTLMTFYGLVEMKEIFHETFFIKKDNFVKADG
jgi:TRAP-type C4-dicarboxylate transport system permease small subunit